MDRKKFRDILLLSACIIGMYFLLSHLGQVFGFVLNLWAIISPFLLGGAFAFILNIPMHTVEKRLLFWMDKKPMLKKLRRPLAILLVVALVFLIVYLLMSLVIPELVDTFVSIARGVPVAIQRLDELLAPYDVSIGEYINATFTLPSAEELSAQMEGMVDLLLKGVTLSGAVIGKVYTNVLGVFFTIMFTVYFLASKEKLLSQFKRLVRAYCKPNISREILRIGNMTQRTFSAFIAGQCLEAFILGVMFFVFMSIFGMPYALMISIFIMVTALIPIIGAWLGCIVGALLILVVSPVQALWFVVLFLVLQQLEGNLVYPHVMGNAIGLPSIWVLFAVVLGEGLLGIVGMLLFIPLTSVAYKLLHEQVEKRLAAQAQQETQPM